MAKTYNTIGTFTAGQVLTAAEMNDLGENINNYRVPPMVRAVRSSAVSIANGTGTNVQYNSDADTFDTDAMHNTVTDSEQVKAATAGLYVVTGYGEWAANNTGVRIAAILKNNTATYGKVRVAASNESEFVVTALVDLAVNDYVTLNVFQNSGGALNLSVTSLTAAWVGQVA